MAHRGALIVCATMSDIAPSKNPDDDAGLHALLRRRIALSFIHRNEGKLAVQMLQSVIDIVGFVAFVDTSSTDKSEKEILNYLTEAGVPFATETMQPSTFDVMRNRSLSLVPEGFEWILVMDCDEVLLKKDFEAILRLIDSNTVDAWSIPRFNWIDRIWGKRSSDYPDVQTRLFRATPQGKIRYAGQVHEVPAGFDLRENTSFPDPDMNLPHSDEIHIHHIKLFTKSAEQLDFAHRLYQELGNMRVFNEVLKFDTTSPVDVALDTQPARRLHSISLRDHGRAEARAYWAEWNHQFEASRPFSEIMRGTTVENWRRFIPAGATCIDIGGHSGDTAIPMAIFASDLPRGTHGNIFVVEPNPDVFEILQINLLLNANIGRFKAYRCAITREDQSEVLIADHANANCNGGIADAKIEALMEERLRDAERIVFKVPGLCLDSFIKQNLSSYERRQLAFIKIDCEGYDKEILWASKDVLMQARPVIMVEWFDMFNQEQSENLFQAVEHIDYVPFEAHSLALANIGRKVNDLLLVPKSRISEFF